MAYWSVYVSKEDERKLKGKIQSIADENRWSFSQAIAAILHEHLIEEKKKISEEKEWDKQAIQSFFDGYPEKDKIYDTL